VTALALALALAAGPGVSSRLPAGPLDLYRIAWMRPVVGPQAMESRPLEPGGVAVDPETGYAVFGTRDGWIHALRPDGSVAWELRTDGSFWAPPAVDHGVAYVGCTDGRLYALAMATGKELWRYDAKEELGTRPAIANGTVFVMSLQDTLFAVDAKTGAWKWHHRREARGGFTVRGAAWPIVRGDTVWAGYSDGWVAALDVANGATRWERTVAPAGDYLDVDAIQLDGKRLYATAFSGAVLAMDAGSGEPIWAFRAPGASRLVLGRGAVFVVTASSVHALDPSAGNVLWTAPLGGAPGGGAPVVAGPWVLVPAGQGGLRFLDASSGRTLRVLDPGTGISSTPGVGGERVYVLSNGGDLLALDLR
jgi:outer membrane protein assembly factor BamB